MKSYKPRAAVRARLDAERLARATVEEYTQAAHLAETHAESADSNTAQLAFSLMAALARREAARPVVALAALTLEPEGQS